MKILVIEDQPDYRNKLFDILETLGGNVAILGNTDSIQSTKEWFINNPEPDLIFLTTQLPDGPSFNLFKEIHISSPVIFMADDGKLALNALKFNTLDFLIRPIQRISLISSIYKYQSLKEIFLGTSNAADWVLGYKESGFRSSFNDLNAYKMRMAVSVGDKIKSIAADEIAYFMADGNIVYMITNQYDKYVINYKLEEIIEKFNPNLFFRLNRTFIVHINAIKETRKHFNGRLKIYLNPRPEKDEEIFVSRNRVTDYLSWLGE